MTTITVEVPDELAAQLNIDAALLPKFVREAIEAKLAKQSESSAGEASRRPLYQEIVDFLASGPTAEQIVDFKISESAQERLEDLLERNRESELAPEETTEMDRYLQFSHAMILLKASSRRVLSSPEMTG